MPYPSPDGEAVGEVVFSYGGNPGVGSLHRLRDAVEKHWPHRLTVHEHSHAGLANRYVARRYGQKQINGRPQAVIADLLAALAEAAALGYVADRIMGALPRPR